MIIDTHMHACSSGAAPFPLLPSSPPPAQDFDGTIEGLSAAMAACGVDAAVLVQWSSRHGHDNSYASHGAVTRPAQFAGVCTVDLDAAEAADCLSRWATTGAMRGVRLFNGFPTPGRDDMTRVDDPKSRIVIERSQSLGIPVHVMSAPAGLDAVIAVARDYPEVDLIIDHLAMADDPEILLSLAGFANVSLKYSSGVIVTRQGLKPSAEGLAHERHLMGSLVRKFGPDRLMWGSDYPQTRQPYADLVDLGMAVLHGLDASEQQLILGGNARRRWPALCP